MPRPDPQDFLPLRPVELQVLAGLSRGPRHGYALLQEARDRGEGGAVPGLATLYRALLRLEGEALIERASDPAAEEDERRRTYVLTLQGRAVLDAEVERLTALLDVARSPAGGGS